MINTDLPMMPVHPDEMTSTEQEPDPDSPVTDDPAYCRWVTADRHHFDHNISDSRWADHLLSSELKCVRLTDLAARRLPAQFPQRIEVSVLWTDDQTIARINRQFRGKSVATNILSFLSSDHYGSAGDSLFFGDLVLSYETVMSEAQAAEIAEQDHIAHLVLHGLLHLAGFDHINDDEASEMESLETYLLSEVGIADPYHDVVYLPTGVRDTPS
jgi:probable rRNA maturation factor